MSKFSQLLKMVRILNSGCIIKTETLANVLGVSKRMIRKYVNDIKDANLSIKSISGSWGGYYFEKDLEGRNMNMVNDICPNCKNRMRLKDIKDIKKHNKKTGENYIQIYLEYQCEKCGDEKLNKAYRDYL